MAPADDVFVVGVGLSPFLKPHPSNPTYLELAYEASIKALLDASLSYDAIGLAVAGFCYGDSTSGQRALYQLGTTGLPVYNVNNNCSTGSTALDLARSLLQAGNADTALVLGFEQMAKGALQMDSGTARPAATERFGARMAANSGVTGAPGTAQFFGNAGRAYMEQHGARAEDFAELARVIHQHASKNPYAQLRDDYTLEEIQNSPMVFEPLTRLQCCPTSDGAAAAVLVSSAFLERNPHLRARAVRIAAQELFTDTSATFTGGPMELVGAEMARDAAQAAYAAAGIAPSDIDVVELHDCFSANALLSLDALGLCAPGAAPELVRQGKTTFGGGAGGVVVNPSGGLLGKGHPLGATGVAQCAELVWQLRGWARNRQVEGARWALQHNLGLGGAVAVTVYERADGKRASAPREGEAEAALGYNPAVVAGGFSAEMARRARSQTAPSEWALADTEEKVLARFKAAEWRARL